MGYIGADAVEDALERSKDVLLPFDFWTWTRLAVIMIFIGGSGLSGITNFPFSSFSSYDDSGTDFGATSSSDFQSSVHDLPIDQSITGLSTASTSESGLALVAVVGFLILSLVGVFAYLNSLAKFVLLRGLDDKSIKIRKNIGRHYFDALKYTIFNLGIGVLLLGTVAAWLGSFFVNPIVGILLTFLILPLLILINIFNGVVNDFALLEVINTDKGLIQSIKHVLPRLTEDWGEFGIYLIIRLLVNTLVGIASFSATMILTVLYLIIFGIFTIALAAINSALAAIPVIIGILIWITTTWYVTVPFNTYKYSYFVELYKGFID